VGLRLGFYGPLGAFAAKRGEYPCVSVGNRDERTKRAYCT